MKAFLSLFEQRIRGVRLIEIIGLVLALGMIFWVCLSKAREGEDIKRLAKLDAQIAEESKTVQDLRVKVAELERPARLEALATTYLGMKPVASSHETQLEALGDISRATSRPVAAAASPETPASASSTDDLISKAESKAAQPVPVSLPKAEGAR
ncbi:MULTISPECIES: septum formation inhibitor MinC [Asticcacaulis]|uniref:cell division protein FtsL n=1 Tax=Asticcacaulis TaxID=76890 RepID=UPI001AE982F5|nr:MULTISPECIES: septum formation inhibitor MinC [Asticcacaulis]MBP2157637.1 cell division protein FtsL [Asticcacaulis solisilvae]MDR6798682.1 cell division protein FtsL [Asticcacaulis sp. BE141]